MVMTIGSFVSRRLSYWLHGCIHAGDIAPASGTLMSVRPGSFFPLPFLLTLDPSGKFIVNRTRVIAPKADRIAAR
jgi:hypothetical protein